jgi:hypothetical protein
MARSGGFGHEWGKEESSFSEEKEAKRRLSVLDVRPLPLLNGEKFFGSFFQERTSSFYRPVILPRQGGGRGFAGVSWIGGCVSPGIFEGLGGT